MVKRAHECKLSGNEQFLEEIYNDGGELAVDHFVTAINNAMDASAGFEDFLCTILSWTPLMFYAPIYNTSVEFH